MNRTCLLLLFTAGIAWAGGKFSDAQLKARFYYDLGPAEIDVSKYPEAQQDNYQIFRKTCSQCHTLARPINSPLFARKDWQRYLRRMQERTKSRPGTVISDEYAKLIVDFLAYDAQVRKVEHKQDFADLTETLKARFQEVKAERSRQQKKGKVQESAPYTGIKP